MPMKPYHPAADGNANHLQAMRGRINYQQDLATSPAGLAQPVGVLPPGAIVVGGGVQVVTVFNGTVTDVLDIGTTGTADGFASDLDITAAGFIVLDDLAAHTQYSDTDEVVVTASFTSGGGDATAGVADVILYYVTRAPGQ